MLLNQHKNEENCIFVAEHFNSPVKVKISPKTAKPSAF